MWRRAWQSLSLFFHANSNSNCVAACLITLGKRLLPCGQETLKFSLPVLLCSYRTPLFHLPVVDAMFLFVV